MDKFIVKKGKVKQTFSQKREEFVKSFGSIYDDDVTEEKDVRRDSLGLAIELTRAEYGSLDGAIAYSRLYDHLNIASDDIFTLAVPMLYISSLIYTMAALRKVMKEKESADELEKKELILGENEEATDRKTLFKPEIEASALHDFILLNEKRLEESEIIDQSQFATELNVRAIMGLKGLQEAYISCMDDKNETSEMVYGVCVNRKHKRITVAFRGTVFALLTHRDAGTDADARKGWEEIPDDLRDDVGGKKFMAIHNGFQKYMNEKIGKIVGVIKPLLEEAESKYSLFVTGHSLGGALATFGAFKLATHPDLKGHLANPVVCISFASPYVGDQDWANAFEALEKRGRIRHIRFSNRSDLVPTIPNRFFLSFLPPGLEKLWFSRVIQTGLLSLWPSKLIHTGTNIFLEDRDHFSVGRPVDKHLLLNEQHCCGALCPPADYLKMHSNDVCWDRMQGNEDRLKKLTINRLYETDSSGRYYYTGQLVDGDFAIDTNKKID
eukprot:CAMPEP_0116156678 /NCGR_PEP_ID=MMETSP0329-20121206/22956_1 /TAXON_ID=697910 /ORGANISM="Pseudo-nitzschia arenysensis, Strain B593" /LENGTH=495 /DNA_ID=CAMNT_0003653769 /DNA_START=102 /DNA_END=1590 /DNA_ORIENTATION=-